jgi:hypothetical protein
VTDGVVAGGTAFEVLLCRRGGAIRDEIEDLVISTDSQEKDRSEVTEAFRHNIDTVNNAHNN